MKIINPVNNFSGNRFLHVLKCGFLSPEFRLCVMSMAVMYMIFFFVKLFDSAPVYEMLDELSGFTFLTMVFGITFGASFFAASLSDKGNRISHIMLPFYSVSYFGFRETFLPMRNLILLHISTSASTALQGLASFSYPYWDLYVPFSVSRYTFSEEYCGKRKAG